MRHQPRRRFSQNFLVDNRIIDAIVAAIAPRAGDNMLEIGPGLGALTRPLVAATGLLHVAEIDRDLIARLEQSDLAPGLVIHPGDVLGLDVRGLGPGLRVVGNLPYNISTPVLFHLAAACDVLRDVHVMLQREVVERMIAQPGSSACGRLTIMLQYRFNMEKLFDVPPGAFDPPPQVRSTVVRLRPVSDAPRAIDEQVFARIVLAAYAQRRKTLRNTLRGEIAPEDLIALGVNPGARAQDLSVVDFIRMADHVVASGTQQPLPAA